MDQLNDLGPICRRRYDADHKVAFSLGDLQLREQQLDLIQIVY